VNSKRDPATEAALGVIRLLASEIGPRRACSQAEAEAGRALVAWLQERGVPARLEPVRGYSSFGPPYLAMLGGALAGGLLQRSRRRRLAQIGHALAVAGFVTSGLESDLRYTPVSRLFSREPSANVVATVAAGGEARRRICLCGHMDSTRSGLMFHPRIIRRLSLLLQIPALSSTVLALGPRLRGLPRGRAVQTLALGGLGFSVAMLAERELRGQDVPGASDNASGAAIAAQLLVECASQPLEHTQVDLLITGCEESGVLGAQAYVRADRERSRRTVFLNFDTLGGDVPVTYVMREPGGFGRPATPWLVQVLERISARRPELGLVAGRSTAGLPTDATVALANGADAVTLLAQGETIPNYHWPTDTYENVEPRTIECALEVGRELLREVEAEA
jgi:hypothetical protein